MEFVVFGISMPIDDDDENCSIALYNPETGSSMNLSVPLEEARAKWHIGDVINVSMSEPSEYSDSSS